MSKVSIFEKKWLDLVFEGKNKAYGAYQLRQQSSKTTLLAFFFGLLFMGSISGLGFLLSSFGEKPPVIVAPDDPAIVPVHILPEKHPEQPKTTSSGDKPKPIIDNKHYVPSTPAEAKPDIPDNTGGSSQPTTGTGTETGPTTGGSGPAAIEPPVTVPPNTVETTMFLTKQPQFPGGMKRFYQYVADNFEKPTIEDVNTISVYVSFVIERDGSMTDIKVLRNPGYGLDKEAIRVLKSLRAKWEPGEKGGQKVRTQYTLPITIKISE